MEHRPLRVMNIKAEKPQAPQKCERLLWVGRATDPSRCRQQTPAEIKLNAELNALSQGSENQR